MEDIITKETVNNLLLDELKELKTKENMLLKTGETLLESLLNVPFKTKDKIDAILERITKHKNNLSVINYRIYEINNENSKNSMFPNYSSVLVNNSYSANTNFITPNWTQYHTKESKYIEIEKINAKILDKDLKINKIKVIDDVFQSVLGTYYLVTDNGEYILLSDFAKNSWDSRYWGPVGVEFLVKPLWIFDHEKQ